MNIQEQLLHVTELEVKRLNSAKIRGVLAQWKDRTACISFYFDGEIEEGDKEAASDICTYIIAHFPDGMLEENYIRWDTPRPLPKSNAWAYQRKKIQ